MPLRHEPLIADLDAEVRTLLSEVYVDVCRVLDDPVLPIEHFEDIRIKLADHIVGLVLAGERNTEILRSKALAGLGRRS